MMTDASTVIGVYAHHGDADKAVKALAKAGINPKQISVIGKGHHTDEQVIGFYNTGERMKIWGSRGAFWGGLWGMLFGGMFMVIPVVGHVIVLGYLATTIVAALEGAIIVGGLSVVGAALMGAGVPKDSVIRYETDIKADSFLVMVSGDDAQISKAREVLQQAGPASLDVYEGVNA
jgi:hypothetical protein